MTPGIRYIVTKASVNGEFQVGDHVKLEFNGDILNKEASGWMPAQDVREATKGWEIEVDKDWYLRQKAKHEKELEEVVEVLHGIN